MNAIKFLYAAYIVTWLIHALYLGSLVRRYKSLRRQLKPWGSERGFGLRHSGFSKSFAAAAAVSGRTGNRHPRIVLFGLEPAIETWP